MWYLRGWGLVVGEPEMTGGQRSKMNRGMCVRGTACLSLHYLFVPPPTKLSLSLSLPPSLGQHG